MPERLIGLVGIAALLAIAVALSTDRRKIRPRIVVAAFLLQAGIAALVLYSGRGRAAIDWLSGGVRAILGFADAGISMVFGPLADTGGAVSFAIHVLPVIIFFSALMSVLYHIGIMQRVVRVFGALIRRVVGTQSVESLNAAANIFVGQTEAPLVIRPYLGNLTGPQLFTVMVSGLASVAGTVLLAYVQMGVRVEFLLAASFMAAPGGLLMAKLIMPDEEAETLAAPPVAAERMKSVNVILAAADGARDGVRLAVNIGAMLLAFVSLIALFNGIVGGIGGWFGAGDLTLESMLGFVFAPLMWLLGVTWEEARLAGSLFGEKLILNEFVAFFHMGEQVARMSPRTEAIVTFSLCGFANLSSIAILLGGLGSLVPEMRELIARYGLRAVAAGSLSNLMSAGMAGLLFGL